MRSRGFTPHWRPPGGFRTAIQARPHATKSSCSKGNIVLWYDTAGFVNVKGIFCFFVVRFGWKQQQQFFCVLVSTYITALLFIFLQFFFLGFIEDLGSLWEADRGFRVRKMQFFQHFFLKVVKTNYGTLMSKVNNSHLNICSALLFLELLHKISPATKVFFVCDWLYITQNQL